MIKDHKKIADRIGDWTRQYVEHATMNGVVLGLSGGIDSALVALLCKRAGVQVFCVNMPCHSSTAAYDRAAAFASEQGLSLVKVDLTDAHAEITIQFMRGNVIGTPSSHAALRSCLRAPTLSFFAHSLKCLIVGTGNRSEDRITRYFQKFGDGCVDFSPIADLFKSEVYDLFKWLATEGDTKPMGPGSQAIYDAKPSADLWGPDSGQEDEKELGLTYDEIEWGDRENERTASRYVDQYDERGRGIIFAEIEPCDYPTWNIYSDRQREIITKMNRLEKISRHKSNPNLPVCEVRWMVDSIE